MVRRWLGATLIVLTLLVGAVVARVLSPGLRGEAAALSSREPAVGDCVRRLAELLQVVDCASPHAAEVAAVFGADAPAASSPSGGSLPTSGSASDPYAVCSQALVEYAGRNLGGTYQPSPSAPDPGWRPARLPLISTMFPATTPHAAPRAWRACLVVPAQPPPGGYTGTVRDADPASAEPPTAAVPVELGECYGQVAGPFSPVGCGATHDIQVLAERITAGAGSAGPVSIGPGDRVVDPALTASCRQEAGRLLGLADPADGGLLDVYATTAKSLLGADGQDYRTVQCRVSTTGGRQLSGPVLGLHGAPLPIN